METVQQEQGAPVPLVTHVENILHTFFPNVEVYINNQQSYNSNILYAHKSYISNNFKWAIAECKGVLHWKGYDFEEFPDQFMEAPLFEPFSTRRMKLLGISDGFMLYGKLVVDFFSISKFLYPNIKIKLQLIRARPFFTCLTATPTLVLELLIAHSIFVLLLSKMIITRKEWTCLHTLLWSSTIWWH